MKHVRDDADAGCLDEVLLTPWSARAADERCDSAGRARGNALGISVAAIPASHRDARMLSQPLSHGLGRARWQQVDDPMGLQSDANRARTLASAPGPLIDADGMKVGGPW